MKPKFTLLNCKYNIDTKKSACVLFRVKNIVYMTLVFKGDILEKTKEVLMKISVSSPSHEKVMMLPQAW